MTTASRWDIDEYLNPFIPRSYIHLLPRPISHFLGHRSPTSTKNQAHTLFIWAWCFLGAFAGVALIEGVYLHLPTLDDRHVPIIIASFGAAAILEYNTIESPLAQPRNLIFGHLLAALTGICVTKLFSLLPPASFESLRWLAGALSVGLASMLMSMTKTVHPPAGATALLAATDSIITDLGWWLLPLVLLGCVLMLASALLINNIMRQFPMYWWTPVDLAALHAKRKPPLTVPDPEKAIQNTEARASDDPILKRTPESDTATEVEHEHDLLDDATHNVTGGSHVLSEERTLRRHSVNTLQSDIVISRTEIVLPHGFHASDWEVNVLQIIQQRLVGVARAARRTNTEKAGEAILDHRRDS